jgi:mono/diheme cytochrome c family protein
MKLFFAFLLFTLPAISLAAEPVLTIQSEAGKFTFTRSELLKHPRLETITLEKDPAYASPMTYKAVRASVLLEKAGIKDDDVIQSKALDGFAAALDRNRLLNSDPGSSVAYVAIEPEDKPWPALKPGKPSAGPFYLIWVNEKLSQIGPEEWPYMLASLEVKGSLKQLYPGIFPSDKLVVKDPIHKGFKIFVKSCFACHTLNKIGESRLGPDLNMPMSPVEYFGPKLLKKYIRNPQSVRYWPNAIMPAIGKDVLSDRNLDELIAYLTHMSQRK